MSINLRCDYLEGCHPRVLQALTETNLEQTDGYGLDPHCEHAAALIREAFGVPEAAVHFLVGGTQTNATVIAAALRPYEGVLCADTGHINVHETGAPEASGHKMLPLPGKDGKISGGQVREAVALQADFEHTVKPRMVYISQPTEVGTLYSLAELEDLWRACCDLDLLLFIDGARLGYGLTADACDMTPAQLAARCHVFYAGGTKCGLLFGEALVINDKGLQRDFRYMLKRQGAMLAKGRLLGVQFEAVMADGLYWEICRQANARARRIRQALLDRHIPLQPDSPTNQLFPVFTKAQLDCLNRAVETEPWGMDGPDRYVTRICPSWATTDEMESLLLETIRRLP